MGFTASNGWLSKWKKRYNISEMKVAGEEGDVSQETLSSWDESSCELMRRYESGNVWNMDETGQFWRALPDKSLSERRNCCRRGKNSKERATWARVRTGPGKPGKSWNFVLPFSRTGKSWKMATGPGKSWKS